MRGLIFVPVLALAFYTGPAFLTAENSPAVSSALAQGCCGGMRPGEGTGRGRVPKVMRPPPMPPGAMRGLPPGLRDALRGATDSRRRSRLTTRGAPLSPELLARIRHEDLLESYIRIAYGPDQDKLDPKWLTRAKEWIYWNTDGALKKELQKDFNWWESNPYYINTFSDWAKTAVDYGKTGVIVAAGLTQPELVPVLIAIDGAAGRAETAAQFVGETHAGVTFEGKTVAGAAWDSGSGIIIDKVTGKVIGKFTGKVGSVTKGGKTTFNIGGQEVTENLSSLRALGLEQGMDNLRKEAAGKVVGFGKKIIKTATNSGGTQTNPKAVSAGKKMVSITRGFALPENLRSPPSK